MDEPIAADPPGRIRTRSAALVSKVTVRLSLFHLVTFGIRDATGSAGLSTCGGARDGRATEPGRAQGATGLLDVRGGARVGRAPRDQAGTPASASSSICRNAGVMTVAYCGVVWTLSRFVGVLPTKDGQRSSQQNRDEVST